ncbi:MAG TPA: UDP-N-acetylmuramoyl-tripeptide--D-alanyl-D-alanine ligase [Oscillospiraceae bacterium]|nr:UDP-N-acetylmuramoyl-tripeptide--D-alanyl-D-alanine ligase [Oscillospiraceae bacterium]
MKISFEEISSVLNVKIPLEGFIKGVSTDTRTIAKNDLFIALIGENFDGNNYVEQALKSGAAAAICTRSNITDKRIIIVDDTLSALRDIASLYRSKFDVKLYAITGSVGKTTTRGMAAKVLSVKYKTLANENNLNNEIGVSKTLFRLNSSYRAGAIEMGMNHFDEIKRISLSVKPTAAIITNIGTAHIENLGSHEGVLKAKLEVLEGLKKGAPLILNGDDKLLRDYKNDDFNIIKFGINSKQNDILADEIKLLPNGSYYTVRYKGESAKGFVPSAGRHNIYNALSAVAAGVTAGIKLLDCVKAIEDFTVEGRRQKITKKGGITFIEDCYNASPESVKAALDTLYHTKGKRLIAVLGDMLELGETSEKSHKESGERASKIADIIYTYGELSKLTAKEAKKHGCKSAENFMSKEKLSQSLINTLQKGDTVLFKASRGMKLEDVINRVYDELFKEKEG